MTGALTDLERAALDAVDMAVIGRLLEDLVAIPSETGSAAESDAQHWVARRCDHLGLDVDLWQMDLDALRAADGFPGTEAARSEAWGMVAVTPGTGDGPTLVLQGHVDVVPPGDLDQWPGGEPFTPRVEGDVLHGRGACDMKAGVVANLVALDAVQRAGARLRGRVALHTVVSEEDGGLGAFGTLARGHRGDVCVITEPTGGDVVTANGGALTFTLQVPGRATHGSTRYEGVSALEKFVPVHEALAELERRRNTDVDPLLSGYPIAYPLSVGRVVAGDWSSSVPDLLTAEGRLGVRLGEDVAQARADLEECVAGVCAGDPWLADHPVTVSWTGGQFASGRFPVGHPFLGVVQQAHADATGGPPPRECGAPYGSDLRLYNAAGIPSLHLGPGQAKYAHSPLEQVRLTEVADVARALALVVLRTCGTR
jgi:acetylornithine deacetylase